MALRYTKVSGTGEQFEFVEGELPLDVVREQPAELAGPRSHSRRRSWDSSLEIRSCTG